MRSLPGIALQEEGPPIYVPLNPWAATPNHKRQYMLLVMMTTMMTTNDDKGNDGHSDDNDENGEDDLVRQFHTRAPPKQTGHRCDDRALLSQGFRCSTEQIEMIYLLKS